MDSESDDGVGAQAPPLTKQISNILNRYPEGGQILKVRSVLTHKSSKQMAPYLNIALLRRGRTAVFAIYHCVSPKATITRLEFRNSLILDW